VHARNCNESRGVRQTMNRNPFGMKALRRSSHAWLLGLVALSAISGCDDKATDPIDVIRSPVTLQVSGRGGVDDRYTAEVWVVGSVGYTTTWGTRTLNGVLARGNAVKIWNVSGAAPVLVDSLIVPDAT